MTPWPPDLGVRTVDYYNAHARLLRAEARSAAIKSLFALFATTLRYGRASFINFL
jgi:hypothetical protein